MGVQPESGGGSNRRNALGSSRRSVAGAAARSVGHFAVPDPGVRNRVVPRGGARLRGHDLTGEPAIQAENLGKRFRLGVGGSRYDTLRDALARAVRPGRDERRDLWALRGVDLEVKCGEALGIVGPNGAGKTTLLRILAGITYPTEGIARTRGTVGSLLDVGTGFHPELTGRENIYLSGAILGMR